MRLLLAAALLAASTLALAAEAVSRLEAQASVAASQERCLDHSVRELGMSARQVPGARRWNIDPKFIHPSVSGGTVEVWMDGDGTRNTAHVSVTWPGGPKDDTVQRELEKRVTSMADMMGLACGASPRSGRCAFTAPGAPAKDCTPAR